MHEAFDVSDRAELSSDGESGRLFHTCGEERSEVAGRGREQYVRHALSRRALKRQLASLGERANPLPRPERIQQSLIRRKANARDEIEDACRDGSVGARDCFGAKLAVDRGLRLPLAKGAERATQRAVQPRFGARAAAEPCTATRVLADHVRAFSTEHAQAHVTKCVRPILHQALIRALPLEGSLVDVLWSHADRCGWDRPGDERQLFDELDPGLEVLLRDDAFASAIAASHLKLHLGSEGRVLIQERRHAHEGSEKSDFVRVPL